MTIWLQPWPGAVSDFAARPLAANLNLPPLENASIPTFGMSDQDQGQMGQCLLARLYVAEGRLSLVGGG